MFKAIRKIWIGEYLDQTKSLHQQSRIELFFNITFSVFTLGILAGIIGLLSGAYATLIPSLVNVLLTGVTLVILRQKRLDIAAIFYLTFAFVLLFGNLIFNNHTMHIGAPFWILILNVLVIYVLGMRWGILFLIASAFAFIYFVIYVMPSFLIVALSLPKSTYLAVIYETFIALFLMGYIVYTILQSSKKSDRILHEQNELLLAQNSALISTDVEKTVMLKEIHHRVKNNLQIIISLMRLKMHEFSEKDQIGYKEMINRVLTMSKVHERIYSSDELSNIDLNTYFNDLAESLIDSYSLEKQVRFKSAIEAKPLSLDIIVPLGLIFNELISNSLKHAFAASIEPQIEFTLKEVECKLFVQFADNGQWQESKKKSFGLELVEAMIDQLDGELKFENQPKTCYSMYLDVLKD